MATWREVDSIFLDEHWTDEVQGPLFHERRWIFSSNNPRCLYAFKPGRPLTDENVAWRFLFKDHVPAPRRLNHVGQICLYQDEVYVSHFEKDGAASNMIVVAITNGRPRFVRWTPFEPVTVNKKSTIVELQAIHPSSGTAFTTQAFAGDVREIFCHDARTGKYTGKRITLSRTLHLLQGGCVTPEGHLYLSTNEKSADGRYQLIWRCSPATGRVFKTSIPVLAERDDQELEGICYADLRTAKGTPAKIHAALLENRNVARDNLFLKSFGDA